jgi:hypothetical protein
MPAVDAVFRPEFRDALGLLGKAMENMRRRGLPSPILVGVRPLSSIPAAAQTSRLSKAGLVKKISLEEHARQLAERKKRLGLSGRDYPAKNDGTRRSPEKRHSWKN